MSDNLWRESYNTDWARRDQLQAALAGPLTILAILASAIVYLYQQTLSPDTVWSLVGYAALAASVVGFTYSAYTLARSILSRRYQVVPYAAELFDYRNGLRAHHRSVGETDDAVADDEFTTWLDQRYRDASTKNAHINVERAAYLHKAYSALVVTAVFLAVAAVPVAMTLRGRKSEPNQVEIVQKSGPLEIHMSDEKQPAVPTPRPPITPPPTVVPKPQPPPNHDVRTGDYPKEQKPSKL